jgi:hypothetical protein
MPAQPYEHIYVPVPPLLDFACDGMPLRIGPPLVLKLSDYKREPTTLVMTLVFSHREGRGRSLDRALRMAVHDSRLDIPDSLEPRQWGSSYRR